MMKTIPLEIRREITRQLIEYMGKDFSNTLRSKTAGGNILTTNYSNGVVTIRSKHPKRRGGLA